MKLVAPEIDAYAAAHSSAVEPLLEELQAETRAKTKQPQMIVGAVEGTLLRLLCRLSGARRVLEAGTFTGYSALCLAAGLPADGTVLTCEVDELHASIARRYFARSPLGGKIELVMGAAIETMRAQPAGSIDLLFLDADKESYPAYHEEALRLLRPGGLLVADNVLWSGRVVEPAEGHDEETRALVELSRRVKQCGAWDHALLTVRDGLMVAVRR